MTLEQAVEYALQDEPGVVAADTCQPVPPLDHPHHTRYDASDLADCRLSARRLPEAADVGRAAMLAKTLTCAVVGLEGALVEVEVGPGLSASTIVDVHDKAACDAGHRGRRGGLPNAWLSIHWGDDESPDGRPSSRSPVEPPEFVRCLVSPPSNCYYSPRARSDGHGRANETIALDTVGAKRTVSDIVQGCSKDTVGMLRARGITVVGSYNVGLFLKGQRLPATGETVVADSFVEGAGGKGSNQAIAAARFGAPTTFVGRIGQTATAATRSTSTAASASRPT